MKHHNNLTDDQIHKPKGFQGAPNRSLMIKNSQGSLEWKEGNYTSSVVITCIAGTNLHNMYFCLSNNYDTIKYAVHFKMDSSFSSFIVPEGYDLGIEVDCTGTGVNSTAVEVATALNTAIDGHSDFSSTRTDEVVTITGLTSAADPFDVSTDFTIVATQTKITNEFLSTDSSGDIAWTASTPHTPEGTEVKSTGETLKKYLRANTAGGAVWSDIEGTEIKSTGEAGGTKVLTEDGDGGAAWETPTGGVSEGVDILSTDIEGTTKYLRADGDGTCSWQTVSGGDGDITGVTLASDSGSAEDLTANVNLTIAGGTGITTSATDSTVTIALTEDKKSKSDIDTLTGVTETDLGTFTGATIADSSSIKTAMQSIETKVETKATSSVRGIAKFNTADFTVSDGDVTLTSRTEYVHTRFSANNLDIAGTAVNGDGDNIWIVPEVNNNKDLMFSVACDSLATLYERALRTSLVCPLTNETWKLVGGKCIASGENSSSYEIAIYSADLDSEQATNVPLTNMGDFNITGSANGTMTHNNLVTDSTLANHDAVEGDGIIFALRNISDEEENSDYDIRGSITLKFEVTTS